jgi:hypothetical protein
MKSLHSLKTQVPGITGQWCRGNMRETEGTSLMRYSVQPRILA